MLKSMATDWTCENAAWLKETVEECRQEDLFERYCAEVWKESDLAKWWP
jgi:hypothetical protein